MMGALMSNKRNSSFKGGESERETFPGLRERLPIGQLVELSDVIGYREAGRKARRKVEREVAKHNAHVARGRTVK